MTKDALLIEKGSIIKHLKKERRLLMEIKSTSLINKKNAQIRNNPSAEELKERKEIIWWRFTALMQQFIPHKPIWLISDRIDKAGDNGEALFAYISSLKGEKPDVYFVISGKSSDYERLKKIGKVIDRDSKQYMKLFLKADIIVSAHAEAYITNPFSFEHTRALKNFICNKPFVFLQHGVTKDDLSGWLQKYNKNISMFVTATKPEYQSVLDYDYFYTEKEVVMTGFPRYDRLENNPQKIITIMPTWRANLVSPINPQTGQRSLLPGFKESMFYQMYNSLFSDVKFWEEIEDMGYQVQILMHPNMDITVSEFTIAKQLKMLSYSTLYRDIFSQSNLIITDYSSVAFDFAYLRKPVIYYQPDKTEFFSGSHTYVQGYFDYEKDGFGEVCTDVKALEDSILSYIKSDCILKDLYKDRINATFPYADQNNCERVYKEIQKL